MADERSDPKFKISRFPGRYDRNGIVAIARARQPTYQRNPGHAGESGFYQ